MLTRPGTGDSRHLNEPSVRALVDPLTEAGQIGRAGITDLEFGYGSRNAREWDPDMADLTVFKLTETTAEHLQRARQVQRLSPCFSTTPTST
jgi:hypothetical protein